MPLRGILVGMCLIVAGVILGTIWKDVKMCSRIGVVLAMAGLALAALALGCQTRITHEEAGYTGTFHWAGFSIAAVMIAFGIYRFYISKEWWYILLGICGALAIGACIFDYMR